MDNENSSTVPALELSGESREEAKDTAAFITPVAQQRTFAVRSCYRGDSVVNQPCGECMWCADNERWERIFQKTFADPGYYTRERIMEQSRL